MGSGNVWLGCVTLMFASIAIGLRIEFATYTLDRARQLRGEYAEARVLHMFRCTGRPLLFNALAVVLGFSGVRLSDAQLFYYYGKLVVAGPLRPSSRA